MLALSLEQIAQVTGGQIYDARDPAALVTGPVVSDSREVRPGGLFVAVAGARVDGHDFAAETVEAGAVAILAARPVGVPAIVTDDPVAALGRLARAVIASLDAVTVIGLTGSSGKTSTKDLLAQVLSAYGPTVATDRSFNTEVGLPVTALRVTHETRYLVLEMGARGKGHISYLTGLTPPRVGLVLNVGSAHVGEFGSRQNIADAKAELVEALPADGLAVLNADDDAVAGMRDRTAAGVLTFGRTREAEVFADEVRLNDGGVARFRLHTPAGSAPVALQVVGEHQVSNALAAAAVAYGLGMSADDIAAALTKAVPVSRGRMEVTRRADGVTVINDAFNANPDSVRAALKTLTTMAHRRTIAVLGEMGELGEAAGDDHEEVGRLAGRLNVTRLIAVGKENAPRIEQGARDEHPGIDVVLVPDKEAAWELLRRDLRLGDVVLVKASKAAQLEEFGRRLSKQG